MTHDPSMTPIIDLSTLPEPQNMTDVNAALIRAARIEGLRACLPGGVVLDEDTAYPEGNSWRWCVRTATAAHRAATPEDALRAYFTARIEGASREGQLRARTGYRERCVSFGADVETAPVLVAVCNEVATNIANDPDELESWAQELSDKLRDRGFGTRDYVVTFTATVSVNVTATDEEEAEDSARDELYELSRQLRNYGGELEHCDTEQA